MDIDLDRNFKNSIAAPLTGTDTGLEVSYTCPAGRSAKLVGSGLDLTGLTGTWQLQVIQGAATVVLRSLTAGINVFVESFCLIPGDIVRWFQTVAGTGSGAGSASLSIEEHGLNR